MSTHKPNHRTTLSPGHTLQGVLGILGTLALMISAVTPQWYNNRGLWEKQNSSDTKRVNETTFFSSVRAQESQLFFFGISLVMAAASFCTCLIILFCWKAPEYSQYAHQVPNPGKLFLSILPPTGFFFFVGWTIFTVHHLKEIQKSWTCLGYSYWLGVFAWTVLVIGVPATVLIRECIMYNGSDTATDLTGNALILEDEAV